MFVHDTVLRYLGFVSQTSTFIIFVVVIVSVSNNQEYEIVSVLGG